MHAKVGVQSKIRRLGEGPNLGFVVTGGIFMVSYRHRLLMLRIPKYSRRKKYVHSIAYDRLHVRG